MLKLSPLLFLLVLTLASLQGCGAPGVEATSSHAGNAGKGDTPDDAERLLPVPDVQGTYHLRVDSVMTVQQEETLETHHLEIHALTRFEQTGAWVTLTLIPCDLLLPEISGQQPHLSPDTVRAMSPLSAEGSLIPETTGVRLDLEPLAIQLGVALADPFADAVPLDKTDAAVIDEDDDAHPGVSVEIAGFKVYLGLRAILDLSGVILPEGSIVGDAALVSDIEIYGDNIPFVNVAKKLERAGEVTEILDQVDTFSMLRLPGEPTSCTTMHSESRALAENIVPTENDRSSDENAFEEEDTSDPE